MTIFGTPVGVDGLDTGLATMGVNASLAAKSMYPWAAEVPKDLWYDYNLPYASVNEARSDWRPYINSKIAPLVADLAKDPATKISSVVDAVNSQMWTVLGGADGPIWFKSQSTPLVFDPMSVMTYGYASCTGVSLLFVAALKSVGVCARLAGTPMWHMNRAEGNHNWIEVWDVDTQQWAIIEGEPSATGETITDPCSVWFCNPNHFPDTAENVTHVYAARFDRIDADTFYRMSWDPLNFEVPGVDRTEWYRETCGQCTTSDAQAHHATRGSGERAGGHC